MAKILKSFGGDENAIQIYHRDDAFTSSVMTRCFLLHESTYGSHFECKALVSVLVWAILALYLLGLGLIPNSAAPHTPPVHVQSWRLNVCGTLCLLIVIVWLFVLWGFWSVPSTACTHTCTKTRLQKEKKERKKPVTSITKREVRIPNAVSQKASCQLLSQTVLTQRGGTPAEIRPAIFTI